MTKRLHARAFSPGHITGFFEICDSSPDPCQRGSRGAGINVSRGAFSTVEIRDDKRQRLTVILNGRRVMAPVTRCAVHGLLGDRSLSLVARIETQLPLGQGFGMSAAGSLSTALALSRLLNIPAGRAVQAAHCAEVACRTGLGDVVAMSAGGVEIRVTPGVGGEIRKIPGDVSLVLAVLGPQIWTRDILSDPSLRKRICDVGCACTNELIHSPTLPHFFQLSQTFIKKTYLASRPLLHALSLANRTGSASMCCLGNSLFCMGDIRALRRELARYGTVYTCNVDAEGARILQS